MLTQTELDTLLSAPANLKARIVKTVGESEWQVRVYSDNGDRLPLADCFESSKQAAIDTAKAMGAAIIPRKRSKSAYALAAESCGLVRVRGALGGIYYE